MSDEITFFGKKYKLDKFGEFKIGRIHVSVLRWGDLWRADIYGDTASSGFRSGSIASLATADRALIERYSYEF